MSGEDRMVGEDVRELREVFAAIAKFLDDLKNMVKDFADERLRVLEGGELGRRIGEYYRNLRDSGLPEEEVVSMTREYARALLQTVPSLGDIVRGVSFSPGGYRAKAGEPSDIEEILEDLERAFEEIAREGRRDQVSKAVERLSRLLERFGERR